MDTGAEQGGASSVELALLWGAMTGMILAVVQVALVFYAGQLALTAAEDGLSGGRGYGVISAAGTAQEEAEQFLDRAAGTALTDVVVTVTEDDADGLLVVQVEGRALSLLPGVPLTVSRDAVAGLERPSP